jgi:hypothetical protein
MEAMETLPGTSVVVFVRWPEESNMKGESEAKETSSRR